MIIQFCMFLLSLFLSRIVKNSHRSKQGYSICADIHAIHLQRVGIPFGNSKALPKIDLDAIIMQKYIKYLLEQK